MNRREFYHKLAETDGTAIVTVEAPLPMVVSKHDGMAAKRWGYCLACKEQSA